MGERKAQRGWLQGRFRVRLLSFLIERVTGVRPLGRDDGIEVSHRLPRAAGSSSPSRKRRRPCTTQGMMNAQIARDLGCARSYVTKLLKYWFESRGLVMPDGRGRRASLQQKHIEPPLYQQIADQVMELYQQKMLLQDIADTLKVDRNTVTARSAGGTKPAACRFPTAVHAGRNWMSRRRRDLRTRRPEQPNAAAGRPSGRRDGALGRPE